MVSTRSSSRSLGAPSRRTRASQPPGESDQVEATKTDASPLKKGDSIDTLPVTNSPSSKHGSGNAKAIRADETATEAQFDSVTVKPSLDNKSSAADGEQKKENAPSQKASPANYQNVFSVLASKDAMAFFSRDEAISRLCRESMLECYNEQSKVEFGQHISVDKIVPQKRKPGLPPLGPIPLLEVGSHFDSDQLWEELELRNKPFLAFAHRQLHALRNAQQSLENVSEEKGVDLRSGTGNAEDLSDIHQDKDATPKKTGPVEDDDIDEKEERHIGYASPEVSVEQTLPSAKRTVRFASDTKDASYEERAKRQSKSSVEDGFFSLEAMEQFADEAEHLAHEGKLMESDEDDSGGSSLDDSDTNEGLGKFSEKEERMRYQDFFDPPSLENSQHLRERALRVSNALGTEPDQEDIESPSETPLDAAHARTRRMIDAMEEENVGKKPWQLRGEVTAGARPKDSLLDTTFDHDTTVRKSSTTDEDRNETIEDIIRQRIVDGLYDDVIPALPEAYDTEKGKAARELPEVSQEKPTESLAEVYAREFVGEKEKARNEAVSQQVERAKEQSENAEQREVNRLYEKIAAKLDALSGLHFTPALVSAAPEMSVGKNVKALASEEAIPDVVSDTTVLTPKEVYSTDKRNLSGDKELTKTERRASRGRSKRRNRNLKQARTRAAELMNQNNPVIAEKRRAEAALLRKGKKVRLAEPKVASTTPLSASLGRRNVNTGITTPQPKTAAGLVL